MFKRLVCIITLIALIFTLNTFCVSASSISAQQYDVAIEKMNLNDTVYENKTFTIETNLSYYAINEGSWSSSSSWVNCSRCNGSGKINCSRCNGTGQVTKYRSIPCQAPSNPKCQSSCNGTDYRCRYCSYTASAGNNRCATHGNTCGIPDHRCDCSTGKTEAYIASCTSCGYGQLTCPSCGGSGGHYTSNGSSWVKPIKPSPGYVAVEYYYNGTLQKSENHTIPITKENASTSSGGTGYQVWGELTISTTLQVTGGIGTKTVEVRVNYSNRTRELVTTNNIKTQSINVIPAIPDLTVDFIQPNSDYRKGTEVISTFRINNKSVNNTFDIIPNHKLTAEFKAVNPSTGAVVATDSISNIVIPKSGSNIVYFKWKVPVQYNETTINVRCSVSLEADRSKSKYVIGSNTVSDNLMSNTPNTMFENKPQGFILPNTNTPIETKTFCKLDKSDVTYEMWIWQNEWYKKETYSISLSGKTQLMPEANNPSNNYDSAKSVWTMKSGYSFSLTSTTNISFPFGLRPTTNAYTYPQKSIALFPEFKYSTVLNQFATLELAKTGEFTLIPKTFANNQNAVHFVPVWYPNGKYTLKVYSYDCWTPAGMLTTEVNSENLYINKNMYDDWYVAK